MRIVFLLAVVVLTLGAGVFMAFTASLPWLWMGLGVVISTLIVSRVLPKSINKYIFPDPEDLKEMENVLYEELERHSQQVFKLLPIVFAAAIFALGGTFGFLWFDWGWNIVTYPNGTINFAIVDSTPSDVQINAVTGTALLNNTWYHVTAIFNQTHTSVWINGHKDVETPLDSSPVIRIPSSNQIFIGKTVTPAFYNGSLDEIIGSQSSHVHHR